MLGFILELEKIQVKIQSKAQNDRAEVKWDGKSMKHRIARYCNHARLVRIWEREWL